MKGHHYMSDTNKFIVLLNKLIINKRTHSSHNNCKTQNTYKGPRHDGKRPCGNRWSSSSCCQWFKFYKKWTPVICPDNLTKLSAPVSKIVAFSTPCFLFSSLLVDVGKLATIILFLRLERHLHVFTHLFWHWRYFSPNLPQIQQRWFYCNCNTYQMTENGWTD